MLADWRGSARGAHAVLGDDGVQDGTILAALAAGTLAEPLPAVQGSGGPIDAFVIVDIQAGGKERLDRDLATGDVLVALGLAGHAEEAGADIALGMHGNHSKASDSAEGEGGEKGVQFHGMSLGSFRCRGLQASWLLDADREAAGAIDDLAIRGPLRAGSQCIFLSLFYV